MTGHLEGQLPRTAGESSFSPHRQSISSFSIHLLKSLCPATALQGAGARALRLQSVFQLELLCDFRATSRRVGGDNPLNGRAKTERETEYRSSPIRSQASSIYCFRLGHPHRLRHRRRSRRCLVREDWPVARRRQTSRERSRHQSRLQVLPCRH